MATGARRGALLPEAFISAAALIVDNTDAVAGFLTVSAGFPAGVDVFVAVEVRGEDV